MEYMSEEFETNHKVWILSVSEFGDFYIMENYKSCL